MMLGEVDIYILEKTYTAEYNFMLVAIVANSCYTISRLVISSRKCVNRVESTIDGGQTPKPNRYLNTDSEQSTVREWQYLPIKADHINLKCNAYTV